MSKFQTLISNNRKSCGLAAYIHANEIVILFPRSKKWSKLKDYYDASSACLIDAVRRDPEIRHSDLTDSLFTMKIILQWLHKGAKDDKKYLGPVLKPYLDGLFVSSLENSWFLENLEGRSVKELEGLKEYCVGVHDGIVEPCMGLLDAAKKFSWAKAMVDFVDRFRHVGKFLLSSILIYNFHTSKS